jgi:phytoene desaturase
MKKILVIGSGFSSLSAACYLARDGYDVTILEKNESIGGRARQLKRDGFTFDMGPTWYWMPDVFERFFADFGKSPSDYYQLTKLSPAYDVVFGSSEKLRVADNLQDISSMFDATEPGAGKALNKFMSTANDNYEIAIKDMVYKPGESALELVNAKTATRLGRFVSTISRDVRKRFKDRRLIQLLEFPVLFLGAKPSDTPAFYSFMNQADFGMGTWHPHGGMYSIVRAMESLAAELGVAIKTSQSVEEIIVKNGRAAGVVVDGQPLDADIVVSGADYHHTENLLDPAYRTYNEEYWRKKTFAPSALLFYVGFDSKIDGVSHHTLFFDADFDKHAADIYDNPSWPGDPLFYASFPSVTDATAAPDGKEAAIFLIPIAPGLEDSQPIREKYFDIILGRLEKHLGKDVSSTILFKQSYCVSDFVKDYNSYKGNAYGLANTLFQTAFLRPRLRSKKVKGLYFTGQLTVPGPGVPPALISGKLTSELIKKHQS